MKRIRGLLFSLIAGAAIGYAFLSNVRAGDEASPVFGVTIPSGYRTWQLVSVHSTKGYLKAIWGNPTALQAYLHKTLPFPDGTVLVKQTWRSVALNSVPAADISGPQDHIQVMVKNSKKYAKTGGWGFGEWVNGVVSGAAREQSCFPCHTQNAQVRGNDFVFTTYSP
ncbi:MAG: cytochrome P460 family protein [Candidatus Eremiobacteraeota bacterium]|nr:cytochrome P460 family protein [Candidatus Eremiobacteraeota bacterium]